MKIKPPCATCKGRRALEAERCPDCTKPSSGILPRDLRKLYLGLYARTGRWEAGLFCYVNAVSPELRADGQKARDFYLMRVKPVEDRSEATPDGLVAPPDVLPAPTFPPFVSTTSVQTQIAFRETKPISIDLSKTCPGCGCKAIGKLGVCSVCGTVKVVATVEEPESELEDPGADFKRLLRGYRRSPPRVEPPTPEEEIEDF